MPTSKNRFTRRDGWWGELNLRYQHVPIQSGHEFGTEQAALAVLAAHPPVGFVGDTEGSEISADQLNELVRGAVENAEQEAEKQREFAAEERRLLGWAKIEEALAAPNADRVFPLPEGTWAVTDNFGPRIDPISGEQSTHYGLDLGAADGTPILAAAEGIVTVAEFSGNYGGLIIIEHQLGGETIATAYAHMWQHGIHVIAGERVIAGQHIGDVGSSGYSTGAHLHFEVRPGGTNGAAIDPAAWLNAHNAADLPEATTGPSGCTSWGA